jgi:hypothetical protein
MNKELIKINYLNRYCMNLAVYNTVFKSLDSFNHYTIGRIGRLTEGVMIYYSLTDSMGFISATIKENVENLNE